MPATATKPAGRTCRWVIRPYQTPEGRTLAAFAVTVASASGRSQTDCYRAALVDQDDFGQTWAVTKELADGTFAESYTVTLPAPGVYGAPTCSCPGATHARRACDHRGRPLSEPKACRHCAALRALLSTLNG